MDLVGPLGAVDKASLFDAFERAATQVGLAIFVVHVNAVQPTVIYASALLAELVQRPIEEIIGRPPWDMLEPGHRDSVRDLIASRGRGAVPITSETEVLCPDGSRRSFEVGVARIGTTDAELAVCYFRNTTDRREASAALHRSETRFRSLIEHAPDGVIILQQGRIVLANPVAIRMFGASDFEGVRGRLVAEFLPTADAERATERMAQIHAGAIMQTSDYQLLHGLVVEAHAVLYEYDDKPAILAFVRDATEQRRIQEQLFHGTRLAALGTMAATVAHEINNPLTYLQLNLQSLEREAAAEPDPARAAVLREHIANAMHGVERVSRIVRDLRAYSRDHGDEPDVPVDVVAVVERALEMVQHDLRHRAQLVRRYPAEPAFIDGSAGRLEQVAINLLVNALQALDADSSRNQVTIEIAVGANVTITVSDTGPGLSDPNRAFEPFFTTKPRGEGTGLGLSVCKQLVERMRGRIEIASTSKRGTSLAVTLPRRQAAIPQPIAVVESTSRDRLRILVIDDEPQVCTAISSLLSTEHDVDTTGDGQSALTMLGAASFDVILCDLMMPTMNGRDIYERIRSLWPGVENRIIFITGGAFIPSLANFLESIGNPKLRKPFTIKQVLSIVRKVHAR